MHARPCRVRAWHCSDVTAVLCMPQLLYTYRAHATHRVAVCSVLRHRNFRLYAVALLAESVAKLPGATRRLIYDLDLTDANALVCIGAAD